MTDVGNPRRRRGGLWWHTDFRRLWVGQTVSQFGTMVSQLALPLVAILALHASAFEVGLLAALETAAFLVIGLPAGACVDRLRFRTVLIVSDLLRAAAFATIPLARALGVLSIGQLYAVAIVTGVCTVFFEVAYQSCLPQLIDRELLVEGNSKLQATESIAQIAGPGVGGLLIQAVTAPYAVLIDAASFLWSAAWVNRIRTQPAKPARIAERRLRHEIGEGLRFVLGNRLLRSIAMCTSTANLFGAVGLPALYLLLARKLQLSAGWIGVLFSVSAVGGLIGAVLAGRFAARVGQGPAIWLSIALSGPFAFVAAFAHRDWTLALLALAQGVSSLGAVMYNITQVSFRQGLCPPSLHGRMNATMRFLVWGTMPIGSLVGGLLGSRIGVRPTLVVAAAGQSLAFLPVLLSPLRRMRELPSLAATSEPAAGV